MGKQAKTKAKTTTTNLPSSWALVKKSADRSAPKAAKKTDDGILVLQGFGQKRAQNTCHGPRHRKNSKR